MPLGEKCCATEDGDSTKGGVCGTSRGWVLHKWGESDTVSVAVGDDTPLIIKGFPTGGDQTKVGVPILSTGCVLCELEECTGVVVTDDLLSRSNRSENKS